MSRARILADYVSSGDELALKAPLISPALVTPNLGTPSAGTMTNVTGIPAAQVGGVLPVGVTGGSGLTALGAVASCTSLDLNSAQYVKNGKFYFPNVVEPASYYRFYAPCACDIIGHANHYITIHETGSLNGIEFRFGPSSGQTLYSSYTTNNISGARKYISSASHSFTNGEEVEFYQTNPYGADHGKWWVIVLEITPDS